ncbi:MAG: SGNH hydrolase domain-containing protein, partial [Nocardioides sp.]
ECDEFRTAVQKKTLETKPDLVVMAMAYNPRTRLVDRATNELLAKHDTVAATIAGMRESVGRFTKAGIPVVVIGDLPAAASPTPPECLFQERDAAKCLIPKSKSRRIEKEATEGIPGARLFDLRKGVCGPRFCTPVVGDILVYRDSNHITKTYSLTLATRFGEMLAES